jgi:hypothetical protein
MAVHPPRLTEIEKARRGKPASLPKITACAEEAGCGKHGVWSAASDV